MPNITSLVGITIQAVNIAASTTPLNIGLQGITLPMTAYYYDNFFQAATTGSAIPLPNATVWALYVRNLGANNVTLNYTPQGGSATSIVLLPVTAGFGGFFFYYQTSEASGGISAATLTAATAITPCEIYTGY